VEEDDYDGWADLAAQRRAEDERVVQRYAAGEGRGLDMRPVRGFVRHVRRDIGPKGVITRVLMNVKENGHEIVVWYRFPQKGVRASAPCSVTSGGPPVGATSAGPAIGGAAADDGLAALARPSAPLPTTPAPRPAAPARPSPTAPGRGASATG
jgi:hypothetical protein